ncbi:MAG: hypothetical protein JWO47_703 [Candidatus Saccharibacteria bacterium]|nr:hypothetical protein [Candidatus Saccharibacteria bacterium]
MAIHNQDPFVLHIDDVLAHNSIATGIKDATGLDTVFVPANPSNTPKENAMFAGKAALASSINNGGLVRAAEAIIEERGGLFGEAI